MSNPADITWYWNGAGLWLYQVHGHEQGCSVHSHAPEGCWGSILGVSDLATELAEGWVTTGRR